MAAEMRLSFAEAVQAAQTGDQALESCRFEQETISGIDAENINFTACEFYKCTFRDCRFRGAAFYQTRWQNCDFANCEFGNSYFMGGMIRDCKADGSIFTGSSFKSLRIQASRFRYTNCVNTLWEKCSLEEVDCREGFFSEVKFKGVSLTAVDFSGVDFFRTPLRNVDLSDCLIENITMSDSLTELRGVKINALQAAGLIRLLGVKIV